ncbi:glycosyltransferase [Luteolibacter ambystomatis]|uniref:Glycosyltransferase n=2 Tax=Luteolibacter ambystomatis TaxID=2824561 RepID=A0A975J3K1_9BACT|nr:glycosyltransferase [Luteolibacter ambystomatis]
MFTNTYLPHVGGVARAVSTLAEECRRLGHEVRIVAPEFEGAEDSPEVLRVPAIQNFNGSDFSVRLPSPGLIREFIDEFAPDLIHSHHPFLLGDAALREGWRIGVPVVFTHHTLYEQYTHYVPLDSPALKRAAIQLATEYCNLCQQVIAPSQSVADLLMARGVTTPVMELPTGVDTAFFATGEGSDVRNSAGIAPEAFVIGHVGRIAHEKNLAYLAKAVDIHLGRNPDSVFVVVGDGGAMDEVRKSMIGHDGRFHALGVRSGKDLADAYAAMDLFVFASQSETQGLVLAEAMSCGCPVVALDGPGVREVVEDGVNGRLLPSDESEEAFATALDQVAGDAGRMAAWRQEAVKTASRFDRSKCAERMLALYGEVLANYRKGDEAERSLWDDFVQTVEIEWNLLAAKTSAVAAAVVPPEQEVSID